MSQLICVEMSNSGTIKRQEKVQARMSPSRPCLCHRGASRQGSTPGREAGRAGSSATSQVSSPCATHKTIQDGRGPLQQHGPWGAGVLRRFREAAPSRGAGRGSVRRSRQAPPGLSRCP